MLRMTLLMYSILSGTLAGIAIIVVLVMGYDTMMPIIICCGCRIYRGNPRVLDIGQEAANASLIVDRFQNKACTLL